MNKFKIYIPFTLPNTQLITPNGRMSEPISNCDLLNRFNANIFCVSDLYGAIRANITDKDAASRNLGIISDTDMYLNSKINYGDIIDELKKITKDTPGIISDVYILDATDGLILSSFSPYYHDIFDSAKHYTLENEVKNPKEFEQELRCLFSCNIRRIEIPSGLSAEETEILLKINQDGLHNEFLRILRTRPDSLLISESIHVDEMDTNHNLKYIPQNFRSLDVLLNALCPCFPLHKLMELKQSAEIIDLDEIKKCVNTEIVKHYAIPFSTLKETLEREGVL